MRLDEAYDAIVDAIVAKLELAKEPGGLLEGTESIVRGDRARPRPPTPALWVFAETATPEHSPTTIQERWQLPVVLAAIFKTDDPELGYKEASRMAARARSVILKDRTLGLRPVVQDTRTSRYEPSGPWHNEGQLYGAVAVLQVTFRIKEGD